MPISRLRAPRAGVTREGLLTLEQGAAYLQIAPDTLRHWVAERRIEHVKVGKYTRFTVAMLDNFVASQTIAVAAGAR